MDLKNRDILKLIKSIKFHLNVMDGIMIKADTQEKTQLIAKEMNRLNIDFDGFLRYSLDIDFNKFDKILDKSFKLPKK